MLGAGLSAAASISSEKACGDQVTGVEGGVLQAESLEGDLGHLTAWKVIHCLTLSAALLSAQDSE